MKRVLIADCNSLAIRSGLASAVVYWTWEDRAPVAQVLLPAVSTLVWTRSGVVPFGETRQKVDTCESPPAAPKARHVRTHSGTRSHHNRLLTSTVSEIIRASDSIRCSTGAAAPGIGRS